jgi:hypothetical protein
MSEEHMWVNCRNLSILRTNLDTLQTRYTVNITTSLNVTTLLTYVFANELLLVYWHWEPVSTLHL